MTGCVSSDSKDSKIYPQQSGQYDKLRELLEAQETFPFQYTHKFIGRNTQAFLDSVSALEKQFPKARRVTERKSGDNQHLALTYTLEADSADDVISLLQATSLLNDLRVIL